MPKERLLSLDVMRGITVAAMLLVNNPGSWTNVYAPLQHATWHGLTPTDLIYPFFIFIMGVSMHFSLLKFRDCGLTGPVLWKITKRSVLMFAVGLGLQWFSYLCPAISAYLLGKLPEGTTFWQAAFPMGTFRIMGVMQGLALAYFFGSILVLAFRWKHLLWVAGGLLAAFLLILQLGNGYELAENNIIAVVDRAILGADHLYREWLPDGSRIAFEPEALLSTIPRIAQVLLGVFAGMVITGNKDNNERINRLFIFGTIMLFAGLLLSYGDPLNKKIWSSSYTLATSGFASLFFALLIWIIDIRKHSCWSRPFEAYGINPLFLYVAGWVMAVLFSVKFRAGSTVTTIKGFLYRDVFQPLLGNYLGSLAYALLFVVIIWLLGWVLYRKKIYIKL